MLVCVSNHRCCARAVSQPAAVLTPPAPQPLTSQQLRIHVRIWVHRCLHGALLHCLITTSSQVVLNSLCLLAKGLCVDLVCVGGGEVNMSTRQGFVVAWGGKDQV